jgi:hypothetical protein
MLGAIQMSRYELMEFKEYLRIRIKTTEYLISQTDYIMMIKTRDF